MEVDQALKAGPNICQRYSNFSGLLTTPSVCMKAVLEHNCTVLYCRKKCVVRKGQLNMEVRLRNASLFYRVNAKKVEVSTVSFIIKRY